MLKNLFKKIYEAVKDDWNILICATKTRGATKELVEQYGNDNNINIYSINKFTEKNFDEINPKTAKHIIEKIKEYFPSINQSIE